MRAALLPAALLLGGCAATLAPDDAQRIAGKTYVVTEASGGIGRALALRLASLRANVVLAGRSTEQLKAAAREVDAAGGKALVVSTDLANPRDVQRLAESTVARFGGIDAWINNTAIGALGRFDEVPMEEHGRVADLDVKGVIYGSHAALRQFRAQGHGVLVNAAGELAPPGLHASYAAAGGAIVYLGRELNRELRLAGQRGIAVVTVMPATADPMAVVDAIVRASVHPAQATAQ